MTPVELLLVLLLLHWIGDFVFQTDWIAQNKSKSLTALFVHVLTYSVVFGVGVLALFNGLKFLDTIALFVAVNAALHFVTDFVTSRASSVLWKAGQRHEFFVMIGFDQLLHTVAIALTMQWLLV